MIAIAKVLMTLADPGILVPVMRNQKCLDEEKEVVETKDVEMRNLAMGHERESIEKNMDTHMG